MVGTGLSYRDISVGAIEACRGAELYAERYTSYVDDAKVAFLEKQLGGRISALSREHLEEKAADIIGRAKAADIAILTGGDPLTATTHKILLIEAKRQGVRARIYHSSTVISAAIGESGLDFYRFGGVCTIPRWTANYKPVSFYETIGKNISANLHTIVLLDYDPKSESSLGMGEAIATLERAEESYKQGIITETAKVFVMHNISLEGQANYFTDIKSARSLRLGNGPTLMIIPASISAVERETIDSMY